MDLESPPYGQFYSCWTISAVKENERVLNPDDKLVYTNDICGKIASQIKALGSAEAVLCKMFAPPRHYDDVRIWSVTVAHCFGMDADTFMAEYKRPRAVARQLANAAVNESKE